MYEEKYTQRKQLAQATQLPKRKDRSGVHFSRCVRCVGWKLGLTFNTSTEQDHQALLKAGLLSAGSRSITHTEKNHVTLTFDL